MKRCTKCQTCKEPSAFSKDVQKTSGLRPSCKDCGRKDYLDAKARDPEEWARRDRVRGARHRALYPERARERGRRHRLENLEGVRKRSRESARKRYADPETRERMLAAAKRWSKENREYFRQYREANADKIRESNRRSVQKHGHKYVIHAHKRRARIAGSSGSVPPQAICALRDSQKGLCYYCARLMRRVNNGATGRRHPQTESIDHKIPLSRGGTHTKNNLVLACLQCNLRKHVLTASEFIARIA